MVLKTIPPGERHTPQPTNEDQAVGRFQKLAYLLRCPGCRAELELRGAGF